MDYDVATRVENMHPEDREELLTKLLLNEARDPAHLGFPAMMPVELAMKQHTPKQICEAYSITRAEFVALTQHPVFIKAYREATEMLQVDGATFKTKAKLQAEYFLGTSFEMVTNKNTSDAVRADLIKNTVRWAGLDAKAVDTNAAGANFNIQINL